MSLRKSSVWAFAFTGLSTIALLSACSGKTTGSAPVAKADLPAAYAHAVCDSIEPCCSQAKYTYNQTACQNEVVTELTASIAKFNGGYDAAAAGDCVSAVRAWGSSCSNNGGDIAVEDACAHVFYGTKKPGEACSQEASDCAPSSDGSVTCSAFYSSNGPSNTTVTQCVLVRTAQAGDSCSYSSDGAIPTVQGDCYKKDSPYYCDGSTFTCQPRKAQGAACSGFTNSCTAGSGCVKGVCAPAPTLGQPCDDAFSCADGFACGQNEVCVAKKKTGEACTPSDACNDGPCQGGVCSGGELASPSTCAGIPESSSGSNGTPSGGGTSGSGG